MKKVLFALLVLPALTLLFSSCDSLLTEAPRDFVSPGQFFSTVEDAETGVNGVYATLYGHNPQYDNMGSDLFKIPFSRTKFPHAIFTIGTTEPGHVSSIWQTWYKGIEAANLVIHRTSSADIQQEAKDRIVGEARFLRALYYFFLTTRFGDVPLWTDELQVSEVSHLPRTPVEQVRDQIIADLEVAAKLLPTQDQSGRATKGAAQALAAKVHLFAKQWQEARDKAQQVVSANTYELLPAYGDVFKVENEGNREIIFAVQHMQDARSTAIPTWFEPRSEVEGAPFEGYAEYKPSMRLVESFETGDARKDQVIMTEWDGDALSQPYFGPKFLDVGAPRSNSGKDFILLRYADVLLMLAEAENELNGPTDLAYDAINAVRERAGVSKLSGHSQDELRETIRWERARELAGEGHRRWDLARWGLLVEAVQANAADNPLAAQHVQSHHALFPVPPDELIKNTELEQNPGY